MPYGKRLRVLFKVQQRHHFDFRQANVPWIHPKNQGSLRQTRCPSKSHFTHGVKDVNMAGLKPVREANHVNGNERDQKNDWQQILFWHNLL